MTRRSKALIQFALVVLAALAAASVWAAARPEQGLLLDARTWRDTVAQAGPALPREGWYRLQARREGVTVRAVQPCDIAGDPSDALFFRLPGTALRPGLHAPLQGFTARVEQVSAGMQLAVRYGAAAYTYLLGPAGARARVVAAADIDGDGQPDLLVDSDEAIFLLLSTQARPGANLPTAELPAYGG